MRLLITGAGGFLGRHVVREALSRGHVVRALMRPSPTAGRDRVPEGVEVFRADLRGGVEIAPAFEGVDGVLHLAAAVGGSDDAQFASSVVGSERLMEAMGRAGSRARVVLASSFSVYDWSRIRGHVTEDSPLEAGRDLYERDGYAIAKVWQERAVRRACEAAGRELCVLRPGWIWGRGNDYLSGIGQSLGPVHVLFGGRRHLALTHVENCAHAFVECATNPAAGGRTFNVVDGHGVSNWRYLGEYLRGVGRAQWRVPVPYGVCMTGVRLAQGLSRLVFRGKGKLPSVLVPCRFEARFNPVRALPTALERELGWRAPLGFAECLRRTYGPEEPGGLGAEKTGVRGGLSYASLSAEGQRA